MDIPYKDLLSLLNSLERNDIKKAKEIEKYIRYFYMGKGLKFSTKMTGMSVYDGNSYKYLDKDNLPDEHKLFYDKNDKVEYVGVFEDIEIEYDQTKFSVYLIFTGIVHGEEKSQLMLKDCPVYVELSSMLS